MRPGLDRVAGPKCQSNTPGRRGTSAEFPCGGLRESVVRKDMLGNVDKFVLDLIEADAKPFGLPSIGR